MKKNILSLSVLFVAVAIIFSSCTKDDVGAPTISITGDNPYVIELGGTWTDPGAIANDEEDGNITSKMTVTGTVNTDKVDEYSIVYKVTDKAGNEGSATRKVRVKADKIAATYRVTETYADNTTYEYTQTVAISSQGWNKLVLNSFADFGQASVLTLTAGPTGLTGVNYSFTDADGTANIKNITGTYGKVGTDYNVLTIKYSFDEGGNATVINQTYVRQ
ncbi:MAG: DUF5011 domain-containing protein [Bacteroidales bacterium]|nr:DUF5011 domain-containing protein [Bacteroidales bacterium]MDD4760003.1 DUF5011 domain-containing protein [Bacteroidaceae bacterium]MDY0217242.1 DUF5011 domain-containing protein [Bacteroidales bacterium]